jgi:hypothetical protein
MTAFAYSLTCGLVSSFSGSLTNVVDAAIEVGIDVIIDWPPGCRRRPKTNPATAFVISPWSRRTLLHRGAERLRRSRRAPPKPQHGDWSPGCSHDDHFLQVSESVFATASAPAYSTHSAP